MTAPMPTLGLETPEQKAARLAAEAAQGKLQAPALSLADRAASTAAGAGTAVTAPTDMMTKTISGAPPVDRFTLAQQKWDTSTAASAPAYEASLRSAKQQAAGQGQLGSGMLRTTLGDLSLQRQRDMDTTRQSLMQDAITGSISDNQFDVGTQTQQQGYQSAEDARRFAQGLQSQQLGLDTTLGLGDLGIKQQQATTNRMDTTGNLEINRAELTAKYGAAEADRMIEAQKVTNQNTQAQGQLSLATSAETARQGESAADLALRRDALTKQYGAVEADRMIEAQKVANQASQFTSGQQAQITQYNQSLELQRDELTQRYGAAGADRLIEAQKVANQNAQAQAQLGLATSAETARQSESQADLALRRDALVQQYGAVEADRILERERLAQQGAQFGLSLAETQAGRAQQGAQFTAAQQQEASQAALNRSLQQTLQQAGFTQESAQALLDRAQQTAMQNASFGQETNQQALNRALQQSLQSAGFSQESAQAALDRALKSTEIANQFSLGSTQNANTLALGNAQNANVATANANDLALGTSQNVTARYAAEQQASAEKMALWAQLATALGLTPGGLAGASTTGTAGATKAPVNPDVGAVVGAYVWNGTAWVPNVGGGGGGGSTTVHNTPVFNVAGGTATNTASTPPTYY